MLRSLMCLIIVGAFLFTVSSCNKEDDPKVDSGTITGVITDANDEAVSDVTVTISAIGEDDVTVKSGNDGKFTVENVSLKTHSATFTKEGWLTVSITISASKFDENRVAVADISLVNASAKISGIVTDAKNEGAPLAGVAVSVGATGETTTGEDGSFEINSLIEDDYTVTFTKDGYVTIVRSVKFADFIDGEASVNVQMGSEELLRGLTASDLANAKKWYYNEYRGGRNADSYPHWDWACNYMPTLDFRGAWQEQNEGTTLQTRNSEDEQSNPADLDVFDSYVFGSKLIGADNKILSLRVRTHDADDASPVYFGVQVVDLSAAKPAAVKIGETRTYASGDYADFEFDLSEYIDKEVIVAVGIYRKETGDYRKQLVLRAIRFADQKVENWDWLPGEEVIEGWKLTKETVRSTTVNTKTSFTGISPINGNRDNYVDGYRSWIDVDHVGAEWFFAPLKKDPEPFGKEGFIIKTNGNTPVDMDVPEAYIYAKFAIAAGQNQLTLRTRNFQSGSAPDHYTYFKLTAIKDDGTVVHLAPTSAEADNVDEVIDGNGCWRFRHYKGDKNSPDDYASFEYDLSQFDGVNVALVFGVYQGVANTSENKLAFYSIDLN